MQVARLLDSIKSWIKMKERIRKVGEFNDWRGCMGLYFTQRQLRPLKKYGIIEATTLKEAYNIINNKEL